MTQKYKIPQEIIDINIEFEGLVKLRDRYTLLPFCFKRAVKASKESVKKQFEFWSMVYKLYPELKDKRCEYHTSEDFIRVVK